MKMQNEYPGFLGRFKASNLSSNRLSILTYTEQILVSIKSLKETYVKNSNSIQLIESINTLILTLERSIKYSNSATDIIQDYIKFGNLFKTILETNHELPGQTFIKDIAIGYLNIAKLIQDSRVDKLAISIANGLTK